MDAIAGFENKQRKKNAPKKSTRKNNRPEKEVEKEIMSWARDYGMSLHIIEAKATFNPSTGGYHSKSVAPGFPDAVGNYGAFSCYIEFKAKGRRASLRENQRDFITKKIHEGAFACVTDGVTHLSSLFVTWLKSQKGTKIQLLLSDLPTQKTKKDDLEELFK